MFTKVDSKMFKDSKVCSLSYLDRCSFFYLLGNDQRSMSGFYKLDKYDMMRFMRLNESELLQSLKRVEQAGIILYDHDKHIVFIKNFLKYNKAVSDQQIKGVMAKITRHALTSCLFPDYLRHLSADSETAALAHRICVEFGLMRSLPIDIKSNFAYHGIANHAEADFDNGEAKGFPEDYDPTENDPANMNNILIAGERPPEQVREPVREDHARRGLGSPSNLTRTSNHRTEGHRVYGGESTPPPEPFFEGQGGWVKEEKKRLHSASDYTGVSGYVPPGKEKRRVGDFLVNNSKGAIELSKMSDEERVRFVDGVVKLLAPKNDLGTFQVYMGLYRGWLKADSKDGALKISIWTNGIMRYLAEIWPEVNDMYVDELEAIIKNRTRAMNASQFMIGVTNYVEQTNANGRKPSSPAAFLSTGDVSKYVDMEALQAEAESFASDFAVRVRSQQMYENDREQFITYLKENVDFGHEGYGAELARIATDRHPVNKVREILLSKKLDYRDTKLVNCLVYSLGAHYLELRGEKAESIFAALKAWWYGEGNEMSTFEFVCKGGYQEFCESKVDIEFNPFTGENFERGVFDGDEFGGALLKLFDTIVGSRGIEFLGDSAEEFVDWGFR